MVTLALLRHAKSSWDAPGLSDFDRPLNERGRTAAPLIGKAMADLNLAPDLILCSSAKRTRQTLDLVLPELAPLPARCVQHIDDIYLGSPLRMLELIHQAPPDVSTLLLVGHNPGLHVLASSLAGSGNTSARERLVLKYPTAGLAVFDFDEAKWPGIAPGKGLLRAFITPKERA